MLIVPERDVSVHVFTYRAVFVATLSWLSGATLFPRFYPIPGKQIYFWLGFPVSRTIYSRS